MSRYQRTQRSTQAGRATAAPDPMQTLVALAATLRCRQAMTRAGGPSRQAPCWKAACIDELPARSLQLFLLLPVSTWMLQITGGCAG